MICDGVGPVAIGGIMGGLNSEIGPDTGDVLIESAYFDPLSIRRTGKRLGLNTESSYRFERGVDPQGVLRALDRAAALMLEVGGGTAAAGRIDVYPKPVKTPEIILRVARTNRFLGTRLSGSEMQKILESIEMRVERLDADRLRVIAPSFRGDIAREIDLCEEIARLSGYDGIPVTSPVASVEAASFDSHQRVRRELKDLMVGAGFFEVINYSFISCESIRKLGYPQDDPKMAPVRLKNPLSDEQAVMRTTLLPGLLQNARYNLDHRSENFRIFELSKVFLSRTDDVLADEPHHLAGVLAGKRVPQALYSGEDLDFADVRGVVEAVLKLMRIDDVRFLAEPVAPWLDPGASACVFAGGGPVGELGRVRSQVLEAFDLKRPVFAFRLDFDKLFDLKGPLPVYRGLPKFPPVARDMALVADGKIPVEEPFDFIRSLSEPLLESVEIFDIFRSDQLGPDKKSIGYRLTYRAPDRSLTDEEVNALHAEVVRKVTAKFEVSLR
jgi:phenylalanyl-tRNA synthetase beta chain